MPLKTKDLKYVSENFGLKLRRAVSDRLLAGVIQ